MWKYGIIILLLASMVYGAYYVYNYDKKNGLAQTSPISNPQDDNSMEVPAQNNPTPVYLTEDFWKTITPQELEKQLQNISNVNELNPDSKVSMLHILVTFGSYPEMVEMLISAGVDYNLTHEEKNKEGEIENRNALFYAITRKDQAYEFTLALIDYMDVNSYLNSFLTPLMLATYFRKPKIVSALLKKGADPNLKAKLFEGNSLIFASMTNSSTNDSYIDPNTIQLLLDYNADIRAKNAEGKSAFDYMRENEEFKKTELFKKISKQFSQ